MKNKEIIKARYEKIANLTKNELGKIINTWIAVINEPLFETSEFLTISDETGEPLYYQNANMIIIEIEKDYNGNYIKKK